MRSFRSWIREKRSRGFARGMIINFIRLMLVLAIFISMNSGRGLVLITAIFGIAITFVPWISKTFFGFKIPAGFEVIVILFIYGILLFGSFRGPYASLWWWDVLLNLGMAVSLGFIGLTILQVLENEEIIEASSGVLAFFAFCFAFSLGGLWEIYEYFIDVSFGYGLQGGLVDTMNDLVVNAVGAFMVSIVGHYQLKSGRQGVISYFFSEFVKTNFKLFRSKKYFEYSSGIVRRLISEGEGDRLEFKSTLRKNLHTDKFDKAICHAVLKTLTAYLNSDGGTLLIGVSDSGKVLGLENDDFISQDKLKLYLSGLLKSHLGNQYLHYLRYELYPIEDKHVLKIDCTPSKKRVFLRWEGHEEFFVRHGPSTIKLSGNDLIEYVNHRFD